MTARTTPLLIDGNNVMGAAADGWWRDRPGAARRLLDRVRCFAAKTDRAVTLVFDVPLPDVPEGVHDGITVRYATRSGRDAADDRIVALVDAHPDADPIEIVTSDRALVARTAGPTRHHTGAGTFLRQLEAAGC